MYSVDGKHLGARPHRPCNGDSLAENYILFCNLNVLVTPTLREIIDMIFRFADMR